MRDFLRGGGIIPTPLQLNMVKDCKADEEINVDKYVRLVKFGNVGTVSANLFKLVEMGRLIQLIQL